MKGLSALALVFIFGTLPTMSYAKTTAASPPGTVTAECGQSKTGYQPEDFYSTYPIRVEMLESFTGGKVTELSFSNTINVAPYGETLREPALSVSFFAKVRAPNGIVSQFIGQHFMILNTCWVKGGWSEATPTRL